MIRGRLGGKSSPRVPEVVKSPNEKISGYLARVIAGRRMPPRAIIVRPVAPVRAVKTAQEIRAITESPPGSQPSNAFDRRINRREAPLSESKYPAKVNRGMATSTGVVAIRCISIMMAERSIPPEKNR